MLPRRYSPFEEMRKLQREMDDLFEEIKRKRKESEGTVRPRVSIEDRESEIVVTAEIPGVDREDIEINVSKDELELKAERKREEEREEKDYYYSERSYSAYKRKFKLPQEINTDQVTADYEDGVLEINMKKRELEEGKKTIELE